MYEENEQGLQQTAADRQDGCDAQPEEEFVAVGANGVVEPTAPQEQPAPQPEKRAATGSGRRDILHLVCGGYLLYLAYKLVSGFLTDFPKTGWNVNLVVGAVGAVLFTVVGVILLVGCVRRFLQRMKDDGANHGQE